MSNQTQLQTIQFHNQSLVTFEQNGTYYTSMKPICENIGLDWEAQRQRIKRDEVLKSVIVMITTTGTDGKNYQMICLPIQYLNGWLFGIDTNRIKPEIRETLIKYKKECYQALFDYWFKGKAEREIDAFFMRHNAVTPFLFNDPYTGQQKKVVCENWKATMNVSTVEFSCTFREVV